MKKYFCKNESGQVMLVSVLVLGGTMLAITAIAGLLMIYQVRSSSDAVNSAKAFFAADAGIEEASWCYFKDTNPTPCWSNLITVSFADPQVVANVSSTLTSVFDITSDGFAANGSVERVLETVFQ